MFIDAQNLDAGTVVETDLCIVGAGAAGITLARELAGSPFRVCLVESGGLRFERSTQDLYEGESVGIPYFALRQTRLASFGGSTNAWTGWCRPLDPLDFEAREWVPHSGWPFDRAHLDPFYERAHGLCEIGPYAYEPSEWETVDAQPLPVDGRRIATLVFQVSPPTRFGRVHRESLARSGNVSVLLHANALELETDEPVRNVLRLRAATLEGKETAVTARVFVLAAGGIENPRLLLLSDGGRRTALGDGHGLVGRFFTEHAYLNSGVFFPSDPVLPIDFYFPRKIEGVRRARVRAVFSLAAATLREERLLNCAIFFRPRAEAHAAFTAPGVESLRELWEVWRGRAVPSNSRRLMGDVLRDLDQVGVVAFRKLFAKRGPVKQLRLRAFLECAPNPESRVSLARDRDRLGRRRASVDWRLGELERRSLRRAHEILAGALQEAGQGRLEADLEPGPSGWPPAMTGGRHHMGTTRMHEDPRRGVVDAQCRVHGVSNLYVAGSSVFPTGGLANPTLTIVALAIRLADHLKRVIASLPESAEVVGGSRGSDRVNQK